MVVLKNIRLLFSLNFYFFVPDFKIPIGHFYFLVHMYDSYLGLQCVNMKKRLIDFFTVFTHLKITSHMIREDKMIIRLSIYSVSQTLKKAFPVQVQPISEIRLVSDKIQYF